MKYNAKDYIGDFTPLKKPEIDKQTEAIYKSKKFILSHIYGCEQLMNDKQKAYYADMREFCEGYEAGAIRDWRKFFKQPVRVA